MSMSNHAFLHRQRNPVVHVLLSRLHVARRARQHGAVLFTAMMLLIVLSMLALSAAMVTGLQERMAGTYRAEHLAFQHTEARLRATERSLATVNDPCHADVPDPSAVWAESPPPASQASYRNMAIGPASRAFAWRGSSRAGQPAVVGDIRCAYFEISAVASDTGDADATAHAVVRSVYVP